jgi:hypothetical protein
MWLQGTLSFIDEDRLRETEMKKKASPAVYVGENDSRLITG